MLAFLPCTRGSAQVMGNYQQQNNAASFDNYQPQYRAIPRPAKITDNGKLEFTINSLFNKTADSYLAIFSIFQAGTTAETTNSAMNGRVNALVDKLRGLGVADEDIYVDMVNFLPTYAFETEKKIFSKKTLTEVPTGFQLQKNIHIRYKNPELLDQIVTAAATQEIYDIIKVDYQIDRPQDVYVELRKMAFEYLETIKTRYAENGMRLDTMYFTTAENAWVTYPGDRYQSYTAFASQNLSPQQRGDSNVEQAKKPTLRFYNAIPANDYDLVVNPNLLEPAAQFTYSLKVQFTQPERVPGVITEVRTQYYLMTPEGELRPINISKE
ncbi:hypothetical protein A3850_008380 [Lewinella sp. 4G2]|nr:hypothetical protein A3850_008380 [Lewinella sp. 4G2]